MKQPKDTLPKKLLETSLEVEQVSGKTRIKFRSQGIIATRILITLTSALLLIGLTILAQLSSLGQIVFDVAKKFISF